MTSGRRSRHSLLVLLGGMITLTVVLVLGVHAAHLYLSQKQKIIDETRRDAATSVARLKNNIAPFIEAFAANEYAKLVSNEMSLRPYYAIVVEDYSMGQILGAPAFITGLIDRGDAGLVVIDADGAALQQELQQVFFSDAAVISSAAGEPIGKVSVYLTDEAMQDELRQLLFNSMVATTSMAIMLIGLLLFFSHRLLIRPLHDITTAIGRGDGDGIPLSLTPEFACRELATLTGAMNTMLDVIRQSRDALQQSRRRLENVIDGTNVGAWEWNVQTGETIFNERWAAMLGYTLDELAPVSITTWRRLVHADDLVTATDLLARHFAGETPYYECEVRARRKDGDWVWVLDRGKVSSWTEQGLPLLMSGTHQDITERKQAEQRLRDSELVLRTSIDAIGEAFVIFDPLDRLIFCNDKYRQVYPAIADIIQPGVRFETIIRTWAEKGHADLGDKDVDAWVAERLALHNSGQMLIQRVNDNQWVRIVERVTPSGHIVGFRVDISELMQAKNEAESANRAKSRFLAIMSHEIRTPMNGILGMAQLLMRSPLSESERIDYARTLLKSGRSLLTLLNDILDLSRVEAGKLSLQMGVVEPQLILREVQALFFDNARAKGLALDFVWLGADGGRYRGDAHRLRQMLANLVSNAIKYTSLGHVRMQAQEVEQEGAGAVLEFSVIDTGIGVPADKLQLLFKPFGQLYGDDSRQYGGSGLGLSIVRNLARAMGGDAGVDAPSGKGSRFWFQVRVGIMAPAAEGEQGGGEVALEVGEEALAQFSGRVLVVEDNRTNQMVLNTLLPKLGLQCFIAANGQEAIDLLINQEQCFDVILMDLVMPGMDGFETTRRIRAWETDSARPHTPILALSADVLPDDRQCCLSVGMRDFIAKPIMIEELTQALARVLQPVVTAPAATSATTARALDVAAFVKCANALLPMLAQGKFDVIDHFAELEAIAADTRQAALLFRIRQLLNDFEFDKARRSLAALVDQLAAGQERQ